MRFPMFWWRRAVSSGFALNPRSQARAGWLGVGRFPEGFKIAPYHHQNDQPAGRHQRRIDRPLPLPTATGEPAAQQPRWDGVTCKCAPHTPFFRQENGDFGLVPITRLNRHDGVDERPERPRLGLVNALSPSTSWRASVGYGNPVGQ